jgi:hypothetical protein
MEYLAATASMLAMRLGEIEDGFAGYKAVISGVRVDLGVLDAVAGFSVQLVERDLLGLGRGWIQRDWAGDEGQTQEAFPVGARGHVRRTPVFKAARIQDEPGDPVPTPPVIVFQIIGGREPGPCPLDSP